MSSACHGRTRTSTNSFWDVLEEENPRARTQRDTSGMNLSSLSSEYLDSNWRTVSAIVVPPKRTSTPPSGGTGTRRGIMSMRQLRVQIEQTELEAARVARPEGVTGGLWVLGYMTGMGTLLPLGLMGSGLESIDWRGASAVVALFGSGVGLLVAYVAVAVRRMTGDGK